VNFISDERNRHKKVVPSLGEFIPLLTISKYTWETLALPIVKETMTRNVLWIAKAFPILGAVDENPLSDAELVRPKKSFEASRTSLRLIMFHVYFLTSIAKVGKSSITEISEGYDSRYGRPTEHKENQLQKNIFKIKNVSGFKQYFKQVKLPVPSDAQILELLQQCVVDSSIKRYHFWSKTAPKPRSKEKPKQTKQRPPRLAMDDDNY